MTPFVASAYYGYNTFPVFGMNSKYYGMKMATNKQSNNPTRELLPQKDEASVKKCSAGSIEANDNKDKTSDRYFINSNSIIVFCGGKIQGGLYKKTKFRIFIH